MQNNAAFWSGDSAWRLRFSVALVELLFFFMVCCFSCVVYLSVSGLGLGFGCLGNEVHRLSVAILLGVGWWGRAA